MHVAYLKVQMLGRADLDQLRPTQRRLDLPFAHPHFDLLDHTLEVLLEVVHAVSDESAALEVLSFKVTIRFLDSVTHLINDRLAEPYAVRAVFGGESQLLTEVQLLLLG
jgi:hypothetical protein